MVTYEALRRDAAVNTYITRADESLSALGFTEHSFPHVCRVAEVAGQVLKALGYDSHQIELAKIAAYLHDIGNLVNRVDHSQSGAVMAFRILDHMDMDAADVATVVTAIGNHDEGTGVPVNAVAAALILADKSGRPPQPRPQPGHRHLRHPRPGQLLRGAQRAADSAGGEGGPAGAHRGHPLQLRHGFLRDLSLSGCSSAAGRRSGWASPSS